jgi:hypothetical protein
MKDAFRAIGLEVGPADETVADEEWENVVAVRPLVLALVDLDHVPEAEDAFEQRPVPHDVVERRDEDGWGGGAVELLLGIDVERRAAVVDMHLAEQALVDEREQVVVQPGLAALQAPVLAHRSLGQGAACADREEREGAQRLVLARRGRVEDGLWNDALGEVVEPLEAPASRDHELPAVPETLEHHLRRLPVPHPAAAVPLEVARAERAFGADALEHRLDEVGVVAEGAVVRAPVAAALHHRPEVRPQLDRQQRRLVRPVLEDAPLAEELRHLFRIERADPRRQLEPVRAVDGRDRVELHRGEAADRGLDVGRARPPVPPGESLRPDDRAPDLRERDGRGRGRHVFKNVSGAARRPACGRFLAVTSRCLAPDVSLAENRLSRERRNPDARACVNRHGAWHQTSPDQA